MSDRSNFVQKISQLDLKRVEQAIALLWFYRQTQTFDERTASELAEDLGEEGLGKPNVTNLHSELAKSRMTVRGKRSKTFQVHTKYLTDLNSKYSEYLNIKKVDVSDTVLPSDIVKGTEIYLEEMVREINGTYQYGFYNSSAVILRRIMESLIIQIFIKNNLTNEIRSNNSFLMLDGLINKIISNQQIILSRNSPKTMKLIKELGDTAAHDRTYLTSPNDIDDNKLAIRRLIQELLHLAGVQPTK